jgi:hypothetical protein
MGAKSNISGTTTIKRSMKINKIFPSVGEIIPCAKVSAGEENIPLIVMLYRDEITVDNTTIKKPIWTGENFWDLVDCDEGNFGSSWVAGPEVRGLF